MSGNALNNLRKRVILEIRRHFTLISELRRNSAAYQFVRPLLLFTAQVKER